MFCYNFVIKNKAPEGEVFKPKTKIMEWSNIAPPDNINVEVKPFLKDVKQYKEVEHNFQDDVNKAYLVTPADIVNNNLSLDANKAHYSNVGTMADMNVIDVRNFANQIKNATINSAALNEANNDLSHMKKQEQEQKLKDDKEKENN